MLPLSAHMNNSGINNSSAPGLVACAAPFDGKAVTSWPWGRAGQRRCHRPGVCKALAALQA